MSWINDKKVTVLADQVIYSGISFILTILIARNLSMDDFGNYSACVLITYLFISAVSAWTTQVFQVAGDITSKYISFIFWAQLLIMLLSIAILFIVNIFFPLISVYSAIYFGFGFVMYDFGRKILLTIDKTFACLVLDIIISILSIISFLIFKYHGSENMHELMLYFGWVYSISIFITLYHIKPFTFKKSAYIHYLKIHVTEGKWLFFTAIGQWWAGNLFVVASGVYLGAGALGALRLGQSLFGVLNVLLQTFENYVLPQSAIRMKEHQSTGIAYIKEMNGKLAFLFIPVLLMFFLFSSTIMTIAGGDEYMEYSYVLKGLSVLYIFIFLSQPLRFVLRSLQLNNHFFYAYFISLAFAISTSHFLISKFALSGVITGLIGSQLILITYWAFILQNKNITLWRSSTSY